MSRLLPVIVMVSAFSFSAEAREWTDASGKYQIDAELVARDDNMVVLQKTNKDLVAIRISQLSKQDQAFLQKKQDEGGENPAMQTWTTKNGLKIRGAVIEHGRRDVVIRRRRGRIYVNDIRFENLPGVYRKMVPMIVSHFENVQLENEKQFRDWVKGLNGATKKYACEGVILELDNGDHYAVPFFFFSEADLKVLRPGWEEWAKTEEDDELRGQYALSLRAQSIANRRHDAEMRQVAMLQLQLQGYQAGLFDLWEVALLPPPNVRGMPLRVVVPARNSAQASAAALTRYPGFRVGPMSKVTRK